MELLEAARMAAPGVEAGHGDAPKRASDQTAVVTTRAARRTVANLSLTATFLPSRRCQVMSQGCRLIALGGIGSERRVGQCFRAIQTRAGARTLSARTSACVRTRSAGRYGALSLMRNSSAKKRHASRASPSRGRQTLAGTAAPIAKKQRGALCALVAERGSAPALIGDL